MKKNKLDELPEEYFELLLKDMPDFSVKTLWYILYLFFIFTIVFNPTLYIEVPVANIVLIVLRIIMIIWIIICLIFNSKDKVMRHKPIQLSLSLIGLALVRIMLLQVIVLNSARMYSDSWDHPDPVATNLLHGIGAAILVEEFMVNILAWRHTKKCIIAGEFKKGGRGFFGEYKGRVNSVWGIVDRISPIALLLSIAGIPLMKILDFFGFYIDGHENYMIIASLLFLLYHILLYLFAYGDATSLAKVYYLKRFEENTPEYKADTEEYGLGFVFSRLILALMVIIALLIFGIFAFKS